MGIFNLLFGKNKKTKQKTQPQTQPQPVQSAAPLPVSISASTIGFTYDKAEWQWNTAYESFCEKFGKIATEDLEPNQEETIWQYASHHITLFMTWIVLHDFANEWHYKDNSDKVKQLKNREISGYEYLSECCDNQMSRDDLSDDILDFVDAYYDTDYLDDYADFMDNVVKKELFQTEFAWDDYDMFEGILNTAYQKFKNGILN